MAHRICLNMLLIVASLPATPALWFQKGGPTQQAHSLIEAFAAADDKGLDPEDYHASEWIGVNVAKQNDDALNRAFTADAERYAGDRRFGRMPVRTPQMNAEIGKIVCALAISADPGELLNNLDPRFPAYRRTLKALNQYRRLAQANAPDAEARLRLFGDLQGNVQLTDAIRHFQLRHGLAITGTMDRPTLLALNVPVTHRVRQLELTLERWRWAPRSFSYPPIVVNIPEFELHALDEHNRTALQMKVVVGRALGRRTPLFEAEMQYVIFNLWWEVPPSIARRELAPQFARSADALRKEDYEVVRRDGSLVSREAMSPDVLQGIRSGEYRVRQAPGAKNALGSVKFIFPNPHNVYLHGTPATELFSRTRRDFSHGCIRENAETIEARHL